MIDSCRYDGYHCPETLVRVDNCRISSVIFTRDLLVFLWLHDYNWSVFLCNVLIYENWFNYMYQRSIKVTIFSTVKLPKYWSLFSLCKHNCLNKLIIYINRDKFFYKSKNITNEQVDLIKWNLFWFCVAKINKRPIRHARKSEYRGNWKRGQSVQSVPFPKVQIVPIPKCFIPPSKRFVSSQKRLFCPRSVPFRANRSAFLWCSSMLQGL